jgi:hypothetical protein
VPEEQKQQQPSVGLHDIDEMSEDEFKDILAFIDGSSVARNRRNNERFKRAANNYIERRNNIMQQIRGSSLENQNLRNL